MAQTGIILRRELAAYLKSPLGYVERIVEEKLRAVAALAPVSSAGVLVADTIVMIDGEVLNKPDDVAHAEQLLSRIAGRVHTVYTRYAISKAPELGRVAQARTIESRVTMRAASAVSSSGMVWLSRSASTRLR